MIRKAFYAATFSLSLAGVAIAPAMANGEEDRMKTVEATFESVLQDLQDAVVNRGLVIDYIGHVDTMLERTADA